MPKLISFYTDDWLYPNHAERLKKECDNLGLQHRIERLESHGGYLQNCRMKPDFILRCLLEEKTPVLWIDVDASILKLPTYFVNLQADISAKRMSPRRNRIWHVGTMWFNYNKKTLDYVTEWKNLTLDWSDELSFDQLYKSNRDINIVDMPKQYFRRSASGSTVILHRSSKSVSKLEQLNATG
jgi:hypothetical protein